MLSNWNAACDCDCCIVYKSEFCAGHFETAYQRNSIFGPTPDVPTTYPLNGGGFEQAGVFFEWIPTDPLGGIWNTTNTACGFNESNCDTATDNKGFGYSPDVYLNPTNNLLTSHLLTKVVANRYQWYMRQFWNADSDSPANQKMYFFIDYIDEDNYIAVEVEYVPDFGVSAGTAQRNFVIQGKKNTAGTITDITDEFTYDGGLGDPKIDIHLEFDIDNRTECGGDFVNINFNGNLIGFEFTPINGDYIGCTQVTTSNVTGSTYCETQDWAYSESFGIYSWLHRYLATEKTGCATYVKGCCDCYTPQELDVTFSGFSGCDACTELNDTFTLVKNEWTLGCVNWGYTFDPYDPPTCTKEIGGEDVALQLDGIGIYLLNNVYYLQINATINVLDSMPPSCGIGSCDYFVWKFTEGSTTPPNCYLTTSDSWAYLTNNSSRELDGCECIMSFDTEYFNLSDFCSVGTVTVENG